MPHMALATTPELRGASSHTSKVAMSYLMDKLEKENVWSRGPWPPNSCNLKPLDCSVWSYVDNKANNIYHPNLEANKAAVEGIRTA